MNIGLLVLSVVLTGCDTYNSESDDLSVVNKAYYLFESKNPNDNKCFYSETGSTTICNTPFPEYISFDDEYYYEYNHDTDYKENHICLKATYRQKRNKIYIDADPIYTDGIPSYRIFTIEDNDIRGLYDNCRDYVYYLHSWNINDYR